MITEDLTYHGRLQNENQESAARALQPCLIELTIVLELFEAARARSIAPYQPEEDQASRRRVDAAARLHARTFLFSLHRLTALLDRLQRTSGVPAVQSAYNTLAPAVVRRARDSSAHYDERILGQRQHGIPISPTAPPASSGLPEGNFLFVENLNNTRFGGTAADGSLTEVDVSTSTLEIARVAVRQALDALYGAPAGGA